MELGSLEYWAMNNPVRRLMQDKLEFRTFLRHLREAGVDLKGKRILDAGCGSANSTRLIQETFDPEVVLGFDFMKDQIRQGKNSFPKGNLFVGDMTRMSLPDDFFDAVFVFGVLHHIPEWKIALRELNRVLSSNGYLLIEELNGTLVDYLDYLGFEHPPESRFSWDEFKRGLKQTHFEILQEEKLVVPWMKSFLCRKTWSFPVRKQIDGSRLF